MPATPDSHIGLDLATASALLEQRFDTGDGPTFYDTVTGLWHVRSLLAHAKKSASIAQANARRHHARENTVYGGRKLVQRGGAPARVERRIRAVEVQNHHLRAWSDARVLMPYARIATKRDKPLVPGLPTVAVNMTLARTVEVMDLVRATRAQHRETEAALKARLIDIGVRVGWETGVTSDGWDITCARTAFDAELLRQLHPDIWEEMMIERPVAARAPIIMLADYTDDEMDEIDGD